MDLQTLARDSEPMPGTSPGAERGLHHGLGLGDLLHDLRSGEGFTWLLKGLLRHMGQDSTRYLLKRHGYRLGGLAAEALVSHPAAAGAEPPMQALLRNLRAELGRVAATQSHTETEGDTLAWQCTLDGAHGQNFEHRINHENAFVWLLMGYAAGFLHHACEDRFHVTYTRQVTEGTVCFQFFARGARDAGDVDQDLLLPRFGTGAGLAAANGGTTPAAPRRAPRRVLLQESELASILKLVAGTDATVLLLGESGVGKSLVASELHAMSPRAQQPWVEINCAAIPEQLIESELFGVERGAFSGATVSRKGKFELAHGGTVFLDEVGLLSPDAQSKLLRVLQTGEFERLGSNATVRCDLRVIAATNEALERLVREGKFRQDLYYRLNVFPVHIPPLRDRRNEIPGLASAIIRTLSEKYRKKIARCSAQAREVLLAYDWPGNIRELENVLERAVILCPSGSEIQPVHMGDLADKCRAARQAHDAVAPAARTRHAGHPAQTGDQGHPNDPAHRSGAADPARRVDTLDAWADQVIERGLGNLSSVKEALLQAALRRSHGNLTLAAASLGLTRSQLNYQLKKHDDAA